MWGAAWSNDGLALAVASHLHGSTSGNTTLDSSSPRFIPDENEEETEPDGRGTKGLRRVCWLAGLSLSPSLP